LAALLDKYLIGGLERFGLDATDALCGSALPDSSSLPRLAFQARMSSRLGRVRTRRSLGGVLDVKLTDYHDSAERAAAVRMFDARFGEMEQVLWCLSVNSRPGLLAGASSPVLEALVWTVKSWWGVQGVRSETKPQMATALAEAMTWCPDLFEPVPEYGPGRAGFACECVAGVVGRGMALGVPRREYSLASKVIQMDRRGHAMPGMDRIYTHVTLEMRQRLCDVLEEFWRDAVAQRYAVATRSAVELLNDILIAHED
jgi:hypothetical protein